MSILFRRRIKIIPGVRLNISKSGLSASVGVRGASLTFGGRGGTYANLGIPGTGIYTRKKIDGRGNPIKEKNRDEIIDKIIELKTQPQTEDVKLLIQKLQQTF